jgi:hypothetical protein
MAGLVPAIPVRAHCLPKRDARDNRGHGDEGYVADRDQITTTLVPTFTRP